ncbi:hypothetical protein HKD37_20G057452 [Glycine soja]
MMSKMQQNMSTNLDAPNEDVLIEAREDSTAGGVALVPPFVDDNEGGGDAINEDNHATLVRHSVWISVASTGIELSATANNENNDGGGGGGLEDAETIVNH